MDVKTTFRQICKKTPALEHAPNLKQATLAPLRTRRVVRKADSESRLMPHSMQSDHSYFHDISIISQKGGDGVQSMLQQNELLQRKLHPPKNKTTLLAALENKFVPQDIRMRGMIYFRQSELLYNQFSLRQQYKLGTMMIELEKRLGDITQRAINEIIYMQNENLERQKIYIQLQKEKEQLVNSSIRQSRIIDEYKKKELMMSGAEQFKLQSQNQSLILQNSKLERQLQQMCFLIGEEEEREKKKTQIKMRESAVTKKEKELYQFQELIKNVTDNLEQTKFKSKSLYQKIEQNKQTIEMKDKSIEELKLLIQQKDHKLAELNKLHRYRQLFYMQREEFYHLQIKEDEDRVLKKKMEKKIQRLKTKLNSMIILVGKHIEMPDSIGQQMSLVKNIQQTVYHEEGFRRFIVSTDKELRYEKLLVGRIDTQPIMQSDLTMDQRIAEMNRWRIYSPSFIVFFKEYQRNFQQQLRAITYRKLLPQFFTRMRLVLDARYNQFLSCSSWHDFTSFPDFLYGFFQRFNIDTAQKCINICPQTINASQRDMIRLNFLLDLINPKLDQAWQVRIFRQFLFQNCSNEEMYFYLHFRKRLLHGPVGLKYFTASSPVIYVKVEQANSLLDQALIKYNTQYADKIKVAIFSRRKLRGSSYVVDAHFILRTLLQLHRLERLNRYLFLKNSFKLMKSSIGNEVIIPFRSFKEFVETNFSFLTYCEIANIYRQCYALGNKEILPEVFFMLGSQTFFIHLIKLRRPDIKKNVVLQNEFLKLGWLFQQDSNNILTSAHYFGVENLSKDLRKVVVWLQSKRDVSTLPEYYYGMPILTCLQRFNYTFERISMLNLDLNNDMDEDALGCSIQENLLKGTSWLLQISQRLSNSILCYQLRKKNAGRMITRYFGGKSFKFYAMLGKKINSKLKDQKTK